MKLRFLVNPAAHRVATQGSALRAIADDLDIPCEVLAPDHQPKPADRVYIEGGDGTVRDVISRYLASNLPLPEFAIVRGGTTDQVAGIMGLARQTTKGIIASFDTTEGFAAPLLRIDTDGATHHGFVLSTGAIPQVTDRIQAYRTPKTSIGKTLSTVGLGGATLVGRAVLDATRPGSRLLQPTPVRITADLDTEQLVINEDHLGTLTTTLPSLYLGLDPFWGTGGGALRFTYVEHDATALLPTILGQWVGRQDESKLRARGFSSHNAHSLAFQTSAPVVLDGDPLATTAFTVTATRPVTFIR